MTKAMQDKQKKKSARLQEASLTRDEERLLKACLKSKRIEQKDTQQGASDQRALQALMSRGCLSLQEGRYALTSEGRQALRRAQLAKDEDQIYAAQHQTRIAVEDKAEGTSPPRLNRSESPLSALAHRKRPDGSPMLSSCQIEAGERFRRDFERGQMAPMMGINWDKLGEAGSSSGQGGRGRNDISDNAMGARQRFGKAALYVGDELSGILIDFCCFLKGLEAIERERQWPARSAKQILSLALDRLARHYGLAEKAQGPLRNLMRHWGTEDYRPQM